jgi:hypothetical protein
MFLIPNSLKAQRTVSKMSRHASTPAHNTRQAVATQLKTQQLGICSRGRTGMAMQTATKKHALAWDHVETTAGTCMMLHLTRNSHRGPQNGSQEFIDML